MSMLQDLKEDEEDKSIYQTFMHVQSIFSRPFASKEVKKSRFFNEDEEEDDEEPTSNQGGGSSIFSSANLFGNKSRFA